jgi:poly(A) polymerase
MLLEQLEPGCSQPSPGAHCCTTSASPPPSAAVRPRRRIRFNGHVEVGVRIAAEICRRMRFSNDDTAQILALVENHMRFADTPRMKPSTLKRFFRLNNFPEHLALHRMDCLASSGNFSTTTTSPASYESMPEEEVRPHPLLTGRELIAAGYLPGPNSKPCSTP